jgi:hypothetical protein
MRTKVRAQRQLLASFREEMRLSKEKKNPQEVEDKERSIAASATRNSSLSAPVLFQMGKEEANAVEDEIVSLYPADNAVVRFYRMGIKGNKEQHRWASVSKDGKRDNEEEGGVGRCGISHIVACWASFSSFFPSLCPPLSLCSSGHTFGLRPRLSVAPVHLGLEGVVKEEVGGGKKNKKKADQRQQQEGQVFAVTFVDGSRCMVEQGPSAPSKPDGHGTSGGCRVCLYVCLYLFGVLMCISVLFLDGLMWLLFLLVMVVVVVQAP